LIVREYINEKFTDESDPIKDLGIGTHGFGNLKRGDEVIAIKNFYIQRISDNMRNIYLLKEKTPADSRSTDFAERSVHGLIFKVNITKNGKLELYIGFFVDKSMIPEVRRKYLRKPYDIDKNPGGYCLMHGTESYRDWATYFKIIYSC
jgi:hypothetical protein